MIALDSNVALNNVERMKISTLEIKRLSVLTISLQVYVSYKSVVFFALSELLFSCMFQLFSLLLRNLFLFQALSGVGERIQTVANITKNTALSAAINTQFLVQIGIFTAVPMVLGFILEQGFLRVNMDLNSFFFFFHLFIFLFIGAL